MPSIKCRYDRSGALTPYMAIENEGGDLEMSVIARYSRFKEKELSRLKQLQKKGLVSALNRKMKDNGARYAVSGLVETLCLLVFECNVQFLSIR
jgi:hypothetical protein